MMIIHRMLELVVFILKKKGLLSRVGRKIIMWLLSVIYRLFLRFSSYSPTIKMLWQP